MKEPNIIIYGSMAHDRILNFPGRFADHILKDKIHVLSVSFGISEFNDNYGGTAGNIAYNLSLLKQQANIIAAIGKDDDKYRLWLKFNNLSQAGIEGVPNEPTALVYIFTDRDDNQIAGFYPGAMKKTVKVRLSEMMKKNSFNYLLLAPGNKNDIIRLGSEAQKLEIPYMFDPGQSLPLFNKSELRKLIDGADILISNDYELSMIEKITGWKAGTIEEKVHILITTLGPKGSVVRHGKKCYRISAGKPKNESDPTGAGDAFRAGFLTGYLNGKDLKDSARLGSTVSLYTVEKYGTQTHQFNLKQIKNRYYKNYKSKISL
ncbi:carbohydrate kinase family protein [Patescibacteria group bacterium]